MTKSGTLKPALLLTLAAIMVVALAEPIAGDMMGRENMMGQRGMVIDCPDNQTCAIEQSCMVNYPANETMMDYAMENCSVNETMMRCMMGNYSMNETMMHRMMVDQMMNESCCMMKMDQNARAAQEKLGCASFWLEKAIKLHDMHMKNPKVAANKSSQLELMDHMQKGYAYLKEENLTDNMTTGMMNKTKNASALPTQNACFCSAEARLEYCSFWLGKAIELHKMHLKNPSTATNESQMEMMRQMMRAYAGIGRSNMDMRMDQDISSMQARLDCAQFWLEHAIETHEMHLKDPSTATNESQLEMMDQMIRAYECILGRDITEYMTENITIKTTNLTAANKSEGC